MKKRKIYTLFSLGIASIFLFGSIKCMLSLLDKREKYILSEEGSVLLESPVKVWENKLNEITDKNVLTTEQIELAVNNLNNRTWEMIHSPVSGQIYMEKAISLGEKWLADIGIFNSNMGDGFVSAILSVGNQKNVFSSNLESFYSFWTVKFTSKSEVITLYINAITGKVYSAEIRLYENLQDLYSYEKLQSFVELADLKGTNLIVEEETKQATLKIQDSTMIAKMKVNLFNNEYYDRNKQTGEYAVIRYELIGTEK